jgi:pyruvate formate lyase activating enzyme
MTAHREFGIKGFIASSMLDWPGMISAVLFLGGCPFRCPACHNSVLAVNPSSAPDYPLSAILDTLDRKDTWIDGVTVTGGEPTANPHLMALLERLKQRGFATKLDTNGFNPGLLRRLTQARLLDAVYMDIKAPLTLAEYSRVAGVPVKPETILESVSILRESDIEVVFRTTVIPGLVEEPEVARIVELIGNSAYRIQPFRNVDTLDESFARLAPFGAERVERMRMRFERPQERRRRAVKHADGPFLYAGA